MVRTTFFKNTKSRITKILNLSLLLLFVCSFSGFALNTENTENIEITWENYYGRGNKNKGKHNKHNKHYKRKKKKNNKKKITFENKGECDVDIYIVSGNRCDFRKTLKVGESWRTSRKKGVKFQIVNAGATDFNNLEYSFFYTVKKGKHQCVTVIPDYCTHSCESLVVDAGEDQEVCVGEEVTLTANVSGNSSCEDCIGYSILDTDYCRHDENYVLWLTDGTTPRWFSNVDLEWNEFSDGTATLTGTVFDHTLTQSNYEVNATFSGKTTTTPMGSPKDHACNDEDTTGWIYYTGMVGTLTSEDGTWSIDLSRRGPAFQMGNGANQTEKEAGKFGACGWFDTTDGQYTVGDFNILFGDCIDTVSNDTTTYLWSTGETTQSITVSQSGTYTVTVENCEDCEASDTVEVTILETPTADVVATDATCENPYGTITFSFEDAADRETIGLSIDGGVSFEYVDDTIGSYTFEELAAGTYDITIEWDNGDCPVDLDPITIIEIDTIGVDAGQDVSIIKGEEVVLTAQAIGEGKCVSCVEYALLDTDYCRGDHNFVSWINSGNQRRWLSNVSLVWTELEDGTATLKGNIYDYFYSETEYVVDVVYTGRTTITPEESPKEHFCNTEDATDWVYYTGMTGTITQVGGPEVFTITRMGPAFQLGNGANTYETEDAKYGGSGWFTITDGNGGVGDFNFNIGDCITTDTTGVTYEWSTGETTPSIVVSPEQTTTYTVTVSNCADCEATDDITVNVQQGEPCGFGEGLTASATPIPTNIYGEMEVTVGINNAQQVTYQIFDMTGNAVGSAGVQDLVEGCNTFVINMSSYALSPLQNYILAINGTTEGSAQSIIFSTTTN